MSMHKKIEKPIDFETNEVQSPPRKVLKVPKHLREQINGRSPPRTSTPSSDLNVSVSPYEIISLSRYVKYRNVVALSEHNINVFNICTFRTVIICKIDAGFMKSFFPQRLLHINCAWS